MSGPILIEDEEILDVEEDDSVGTGFEDLGLKALDDKPWLGDFNDGCLD